MRVRSNPYPKNTAFDFGAKRTVSIADPDRPESPNAFEMKRRMARVGLEKPIALIRQSADFFGEGFIQRPKAR